MRAVDGERRLLGDVKRETWPSLGRSLGSPRWERWTLPVLEVTDPLGGNGRGRVRAEEPFCGGAELFAMARRGAGARDAVGVGRAFFGG